MTYKLSDFVTHYHQDMNENLDKFERNEKLKITDRDKMIYEAAFKHGATSAYGLFKLHANLKLKV